MRISPGSPGNQPSGSMASRALVGIPPESQNGNKSKSECYQAEREKFLQDFEKPTQVYRYLRLRMLECPVFLYRNLSYMRNRMSRSNKTRKDFHIDDILKRAEDKQKQEEIAKKLISKPLTKNFLNLIILGFWDGEQWSPDTEAKLDLQIVRICQKKRKESQIPMNKVFSSSCSIKTRSATTESIYKDEFSIPISKGKYPVIAVPKECFNLVNGHIVQSIKLVVRVTLPASGLLTKSETGRQYNHLQNGFENSESEKLGSNRNNGINGSKLSSASSSLINSRKIGSNSNSTSSNDSDEPKPKRQRSLPTKDRENFIYENQNNNRSNNSNHISVPDVIYCGILNIYDKDNNMNIPAQGNADMEFRLTRQEVKKSIPSKRVSRQGTWAPAVEESQSKIQEYLLKNGTVGCVAKLALAIRASNEKMAALVDPPAPVNFSSKAVLSVTDEERRDGDERIRVRVIYQFVHSSSGGQTTESRNDLRCPWCSINCLVLYSLLKHLKICHPRFSFSFAPIVNGARVDVSINESYDGSYTGSAFDLVAQPPGEAFARNGPAKRTQVFSMLAFRPPPLKRSLQEFFESDEKDAEQRRSYITGHNRLYHHTTTCLPIHPREIDVDSEGEPDPEWLRVKTCMMIDEFTDVNEGEKEIMKMWNHHVMHDNYVGDCQIPLACKKFVEQYGQTIIQKNLYRNFILHLTNLFDFGLLPAQSFHGTIQLLHAQMKDKNTASALRESWRAFSTSLGVANGSMEDMEVSYSSTSTLSVTSVRYTNGNTAITSETDRNGHAL